MIGPIRVLGPAYLDRVLEVDRPLAPVGSGQVMDASVQGRWEPGGEDVVIADTAGVELRITAPSGWPGPLGRVLTSRALGGNAVAWRQSLMSVGWRDDLGGMGAGYASALGGTLLSALGADGDPVSIAVSRLLDQFTIRHQRLRSGVDPADWTLLISSGIHGDKLPIGFRGCHDALRMIPEGEPCRLLVVAALPNRLLKSSVEQARADVVFFAPAMRNVLDRETTIESFVDRIDALSCNRIEWREIAAPDAILEQVAVVAITDGPEGCEVHFRDPDLGRSALRIPAFPRTHPPRDTNRAGEAFASTLLKTLLIAGWNGGPVDASRIRDAAERATVAAALVLDRRHFGFPSDAEIDDARRRGVV